LAIANQNQPQACIAVLAAKDKLEMEDEIRTKIGDTGNTRIICRTGSSMEMTSLDLMSLDTANQTRGNGPRACAASRVELASPICDQTIGQVRRARLSHYHRR